MHRRLDLAKKKSSRVIQLMEELNRFKDIQLSDIETDNIVNAVGSLKRKVCAEVGQEARELADISKQLQTEVLEKRQHVMQLLTDLLLDSTAGDQKDRIKFDKISLPPENDDDKDAGDDRSSLGQALLPGVDKIIELDVGNVKKSNRTSPLSTSVESPGGTNSKEIRVSSLSRKRQGGQGGWMAGQVDPERCELCEDLDNEEVCGGNGRTYRTLCHAVNCAGLALRDISIGSCISKVTFPFVYQPLVKIFF